MLCEYITQHTMQVFEWSRTANALSKREDLTKLTETHHCLGRCLGKMTIKYARLCSVIECAVAAACLLFYKYCTYSICHVMCSKALRMLPDVLRGVVCVT